MKPSGTTIFRENKVRAITADALAPCVASISSHYDDVIKWKHFPRYWPSVRGNHRSQVNSPHKGQWRGALMFSLISAWINDWVNNRDASDLRRHRAHYDVTIMCYWICMKTGSLSSTRKDFNFSECREMIDYTVDFLLKFCCKGPTENQCLEQR